MPLLSMTGYGQARVQTGLGEFNVQLKSVNNRFCDVSVRMPREFNALELFVRDRLKQALLRGKIDCSVQWTPIEELGRAVQLDTAMLRQLRDQLLLLQREWGGEAPPLAWSDLLGVPGVLSAESPEIDLDQVRDELGRALDEALKVMLDGRSVEGAALEKHLREEIGTIESMLTDIESVRHEVIEQYRERLGKRIEELRARSADAVDDNRLEAEVALLADRCDITEEIVRLKSHFAAFREALDDTATQEKGKGLEFLTQELQREVNTIGSKARQTSVNALVVEMKKAIEKIREQLANVV